MSGVPRAATGWPERDGAPQRRQRVLSASG
jgi:hypothetical protein